MNTKNLDEIQQAYEWLIRQRDTMDPIYAGDDVIDNMISGNKAMAVVYSGDASYIISENPKLGYYTPVSYTHLPMQGADIIANRRRTKCPKFH